MKGRLKSKNIEEDKKDSEEEDLEGNRECEKGELQQGVCVCL